MSIQILCHLKIIFLLLTCESSFFVHSELIRHLICKYSFILWTMFAHSSGILWSINIFNYDEVQVFSFVICIFVLYHYLIKGCEDLQFIILFFWECYGFSSYIYILIYFKLTLYTVWGIFSFIESIWQVVLFLKLCRSTMRIHQVW